MFSFCFYCMFIPHFLQEMLQLQQHVLTIWFFNLWFFLVTSSQVKSVWDFAGVCNSSANSACFFQKISFLWNSDFSSHIIINQMLVMSVLQGGFLPGIFFFPHPWGLQTGDLDEPCWASFQCTHSQSLLPDKDRRVAFKYLNKWLISQKSADTWTTVLSSCQWALLSAWGFWKLI